VDLGFEVWWPIFTAVKRTHREVSNYLWGVRILYLFLGCVLLGVVL